MKKQKRKGLALLLAFVMLVSLLYVPGSSLNAYAEGDGTETVETVSDPIEENEIVDLPVQMQLVMSAEDQTPPAELPAITEEDELAQEVDPDSLDSVEVSNSQGAVRIMSGDDLALSPAGGDFYNGEVVSISVLNAQDWHYSYRINGGAWKWALKADEIVVKDDATVKVADLRIRKINRLPFFEFYVATTQGTYDFEAPAQPTGLELESRTLSELNLVWDESTDENIDHYNVYVWEEKDKKEEVTEVTAELMKKPEKPEGPKGEWVKVDEVTDASYTFDGLDRGEILQAGVSAVCKGHVDETVLFESAKTDGTFHTADYSVTTRILPTAAGSVAPVISYWDSGDTMEAIAELNEGYEVKRWIVKKLPMNPVARALGFGETETIEAEVADLDDDEDAPGETDTFGVVVKSDLLITAKAGLKVFTVTLDAQPEQQGTVSATIESGKHLKKPNRYEYGTVLVLDSNAAVGYDHDKWIANDTEIDETNGIAKYTVTSDASIIGTFVKEPVGFVEESIRVDELNDGNPILFSGIQTRSAEEAEIEGAPGDRQMHGEANQEVPYGTTLKELLYHVNLKTLDHNGIQIKDGEGFVDLDSLELSKISNPDGSMDIEVFNSDVQTLIHNSRTGLNDPLIDGGEYRIKFKLYHQEDFRFNTTPSALELDGAPYQNEVVVYTLHVRIDVLDPLLKLEVKEGGKVHVAAKMNDVDLEEAVEAQGMFKAWINGPNSFSRHFKDNRVIELSAEPYNEADYVFDGWYYAGEGGELFSANPVETIPMDRNWDLVAKFRQLEYTIESDGSMTQGKIMYRLLEDDRKKAGGKSWAELPVTIHYGDSVELKAVPYTTWLFKEWITPDSYRDKEGAAAGDLMFKQRDTISFRLNDRGLEQFEERVMTASAEFMSDYGFTEYHVAGINDGADLMMNQETGSVDETSVACKADIIAFDYHVPYGTSLEDAMSNASFEVTYGVVNKSNVVKLYGERLGSAPDAALVHRYSELVVSPHTVKITETINPFEAIDENQFAYRYAVQQYPDESQVGTSVNRDRPEFNRNQEYQVIVTVVVDDPLLTVEVPVGGSVDMTVNEMPDYPYPASVDTVAIEPSTEKLLAGYHKKYLEFGSLVSLTPVADEGYTFSGWTATDGYTVPVEGAVVMNGNYKVKPIFTAVQVERRRNNNRNTPQQQIEQILDETTPLGILYRQLFIGYPNGDLRMFDSINRAQLSLILQRAQQYDVSNPPVIPVADVMEDWYRKEALAAIGKGYMTLRPGNVFGGHDPVTGAELVQALNTAFGANLTLEEAYRLANGVTSEQVAKIMLTNATDFQLAMSSIVPLGVGSFDANKPVPRETVARMIYAVLYPQAEAAPAATPQ